MENHTLELKRLQRRYDVYLVARTYFEAESSLSSRPRRRTLRALALRTLEQYKQHFEDFIRDWSKELVVDDIIILLQQEAFKSAGKASQYFQSLFPRFRNSAPRDLQQENVGQGLVEQEHVEKKTGEEAMEEQAIQHKIDALRLTGPQQRSENDQTSPSAINALPPPKYILYSSQHSLLNNVQNILERTCYDFTAKWIPYLLTERQWDCAEAAELTRWTDLLNKHFFEIPPAATLASGQDSFRETLRATHNIRHYAVHRKRASTAWLEDMIEKAITMCRMLKDDNRMLQMEDVLFRFQVDLKEIAPHEPSWKDDIRAQMEKLRLRKWQREMKEQKFR